ncbi:LamG-like jellyroll fold domain-containing protein [Paenibacillus hamazuiensis]|uniref:LamG-like jellyroll fold domain-containing protein n=1 Tax=Paenibacillus hamazuiensis TaxID=2936508 RepID=UPI00200C7219|nr:exo-alpha-sialidase [Paenibacillus hamazuiensis]
MLSAIWKRAAAAVLAAVMLIGGVENIGAAEELKKEKGHVAKKPQFAEQELFIPGEGGYPVVRIPGLVVTRKGTLIAYAEARNSASDWAKIDLVVKRSADGGRTWGPLQVVVKNAPSENITYNNPLMIAEQDGDVVHFLYCKNYHEMFYAASTDEGQTWSAPVNITQTTMNRFREDGQQPKPFPWKVIAAGPGHGIELRSGRLLAPVWLANGATDTSHSPSVVATVYSDDHGQSWQAGEIVYDTPEVRSPGETTAVELQDGSVMLNMRNSAKRRAVTVSATGIDGWSVPTLDETLIDPGNFGSSARYSFGRGKGHNRILFINANDPADRQNITLRMSEDDGKTWAYGKSVQPGQGAYSEVAVAPDQTIHVLYEKGYGIRAARMNLEWLTDGTQLESLETDTGELSPKLSAGIFDYTLNVREDVTEVGLAPRLPMHSEAVVKVNGVAVARGEAEIVRLAPERDTRVNVTVESPKGKRLAEYAITVRKTLPKGELVGHWSFDQIGPDGTVPDVSGKHNDGLANGTVPVAGKAGQALQFNGGYVDVKNGEGLAFGKGEFTASLWVKPDRIDDIMTLLWYGDVGAAARGWYVRTQGFGKMNFRVGGDGAEALTGTDGVVVKAGGWTHVTVQRKGNLAKIYIDGQEVRRRLLTDVYNIDGTNVLRIGKPKSGDTRAWIGAIDDVRLYNYALTDAQVRQLYESTKGTNE